MSWRAAYLAYDDDALCTLANAGLLRRASKDLENGLVGWLECTATGGSVNADGCSVTLDARGPAHARCTCPAPGICKHKLAAALWVREEARAQTNAPTAAAGPGPALAELLALNPHALYKAAGVAAVRRLHAWLPQLPSPDIEDRAHTLLIRLPALAVQVRYLAGGGWAGMLSDAPAAQRAAAHLAAIVAVWRQHGIEVALPSVADEASAAADTTLIEAFDQAVLQLYAAGLAHLSDAASSELQALALSARTEAWPGMAARLRNLSGAVASLIARNDFIDESDVLALLADAHAWCESARAGAAHTRQAWRRDYQEGETLDLLALGADWWQLRSGARGLSLVFLDLADGRLLFAVPSRPDASDPAFERASVWSVQALWRGTGTPEQLLANGALRLQSPRVSPDLRLALAGETRGALLAPLSAADERLASVGWRDWQLLTSALVRAVGTEAGEFALLRPTATSLPVLDEIEQAVHWWLTDSNGRRLRTSLSTAPATMRRVQALEALLARTPTIVFVLVRVEALPEFCLRPVALITDGGDRLCSFSLEFADVKPIAAKAGPAGRILKLQAARRTAMQPVDRGIVARLADPVLRVIEFQATSGVAALDREQSETLRMHADAFAAAGLETLARAMSKYQDDPRAATALRLHALLQLALQIEMGSRMIG